jgi:hypothetical protein
MLRLSRPPTWLRLCALLAFFSYLFAAASFALPSERHCARCATRTPGGTLAPGTACPLAYHEPHCHTTRGRTAPRIVLCPDGCLRHNGQSGEVPTLAKFLSASIFDYGGWPPTGLATEDKPLTVLEPSLSPPAHPPSLPL